MKNNEAKENTTFHSLFPEMTDVGFFKLYELKKRRLNGSLSEAFSLEYIYRVTFPNSFGK